MYISDNVKYVGVNDHNVDLFEGQYTVKGGMSYNSYVILDEKIAVCDTVDGAFTHEWLDNIEKVLCGRRPDYLIVHHMEPDHSANIENFMRVYPDAAIVSTDKAFVMMKNFFGHELTANKIMITEGSTLCLGSHTLTFVLAPMVHWPEVALSYEQSEKLLFSADAFGKFGALDTVEPWDDEARRYYIGIVGKYGKQVQAVLKKAAALDIEKILPLHGPMLSEDLGHYLGLYDKWSSYEPEEDGIVIAYTSVYGGTKKAAERLFELVRERGCKNAVIYDLARSDMAAAVADAFRYNTLVLATTTYNADIFPTMKIFIDHLTERGFKRRRVAFIENGSWAPRAAKIMRDMLASSPELTFADHGVRIMSAVSDENVKEITALADELCAEYTARESVGKNVLDLTALNALGYGLYVVTSGIDGRDNGLIVNTVSQVTSTPNRVSVVINKDNYSHHIIKQTGIMNVNCLSTDAPFRIFENFGFSSGRAVDKFAGMTPDRSANSLAVLPGYINAYISLKVAQYVDLGSHGMFICDVTEAKTISDRESMTYAYYHQNVKPKPETEGKKGYVCKICGYVYEGDELPDDYVCPLCKHGAADFEEIGN